jgi:hypothetical protein
MTAKKWTVTKSRWPNGVVFSLAYLHHKGRGFTATFGLGRVSYHVAYRRTREGGV